jgi:NAD-dependent deacetylase
MDSRQFHFPSELIRTLRSARRVAVLTGSGISAESGVPTFREAQTGLWHRFKPEELATAQAFRRDPRLVWEWYTWRRELAAKAQPNPGHLALAQMEDLIPNFTLITQNVDGLHQRAGSGRQTPVIELHGSIQRTKCFEEGKPVETWEEGEEIPPRCPSCGGRLRPDVVWFGESLPPGALRSAQEAASACEIFFSIGTSTLVEPAASLPFIASLSGALVVEVNPQETPLTPSADFVLAGPAGEVLPALVKDVWEENGGGDRKLFQ